MRHRSGLATALALALLGAGATAAAAPAHASTAAPAPVRLYVDNTGTACADAAGDTDPDSGTDADPGSGTKTDPYCTIQAAFDVVTAGQTVEIVAGSYPQPAALSASGTASAHITVQFGRPGQPFQSGSPRIDLPSEFTGSALALSGANYVDIEDAGIVADQDTAPAVDIQNSSHVLITGGTFETSGVGGGIAISGTGTAVTVERDGFATGGPAVSVTGSGVSGTAITTDEISGVAYTDTSGGVTVDGAVGTAVVSNTITDVCTSGVAVMDAARGTVVENNVIAVDEYADTRQCPDTSATALGLYVSGDSVSGTTEGYDSIGLYQSTPIEWAGTAYTLVDAYRSFTGQGAQDLLLIGTPATDLTTVPADYVDSANAHAPAELSTDFSGKPRADDPQIPDTGTGDGYYDRGAAELQDGFSAELSQVQPLSSASALGVSAGFVVGLCTNWGATVYSGTIDWGDGKSSPETGTGCTYGGGSDTHTYAKPGQYTITFTATDGYTSQTSSQVFQTQGTDYTPYGPARVLDTRKGLGAARAPVAMGSYVKLKIAGNGAIPADVTAVALNLTVTDTTGAGYIGTSPDRNASPDQANVRYLAGQTTADSAVVKVDGDGYIDIYNEGSTGSADLVADIAGYFAPSASCGYQSAPPTRILDTRKGTGAPAGQVPAGTGIPLTIAGVDGIPAGVTAVAVHLTATDATGGGWVAAGPDGAGVPGTSILDYAAGQTVSNTMFVPVAADGKIELYNGGGTAPVDLTADVSGYFSPDAPDSFLAVDPFRAADATGSGAALAPHGTGHYGLQEPAGTAAVIGTVTVTHPTAAGYLVAQADRLDRPAVSDDNFLAGRSVADLTVFATAPGEAAATYLYNASTGTTPLFVDVVGYFMP